MVFHVEGTARNSLAWVGAKRPFLITQISRFAFPDASQGSSLREVPMIIPHPKFAQTLTRAHTVFRFEFKLGVEKPMAEDKMTLNRCCASAESWFLSSAVGLAIAGWKILLSHRFSYWQGDSPVRRKDSTVLDGKMRALAGWGLLSRCA